MTDHHTVSVAMGDGRTIEEAKSIAADINSLLPGEVRQMTFWHNAALKMAAALSTPPVQEPVAWIEREVLKEIAKHWSATGTVCSPLFRHEGRAILDKVALYAAPHPVINPTHSQVAGTPGLLTDPAPAQISRGSSAGQKSPAHLGELNTGENDAQADKNSQKDVAHGAGIASPAAPANHFGLANDTKAVLKNVVVPIYFNDVLEEKAHPAKADEARPIPNCDDLGTARARDADAAHGTRPGSPSDQREAGTRTHGRVSTAVGIPGQNGLIAGSAAYSAGQATFTDYFVRNYPGPDTFIFDPKWHAPKLFAAAAYAIRAALATSEGSADE